MLYIKWNTSNFKLPINWYSIVEPTRVGSCTRKWSTSRNGGRGWSRPSSYAASTVMFIITVYVNAGPQELRLLHRQLPGPLLLSASQGKSPSWVLLPTRGPLPHSQFPHFYGVRVISYHSLRNKFTEWVGDLIEVAVSNNMIDMVAIRPFSLSESFRLIELVKLSGKL